MPTRSTLKDLLYGELAEGVRPMGYAPVRSKDICKRDMKLSDVGH